MKFRYNKEIIIIIYYAKYKTTIELPIDLFIFVKLRNIEIYR